MNRDHERANSHSSCSVNHYLPHNHYYQNSKSHFDFSLLPMLVSSSCNSYVYQEEFFVAANSTMFYLGGRRRLGKRPIIIQSLISLHS